MMNNTGIRGALKWEKKMIFSLEQRGVSSKIDATPDHGGSGLYPTPKELLLNAMMGCTAMDVIAILIKMRIDIENLDFKMSSQALLTTTHPIIFEKANLDFLFHSSDELSTNELKEKLIKAVNSSMQKYCGVNHMISHACPISYQIKLNDIHIGEGQLSHRQKS